MKILIIEDADDVAEMFARFLESNGHACEVSLGGRAGVEAFEQGRFDLVLADLTMPGLTGYDVAERIRERDARVPLLLVTGQTDDVLVKAHASRAGFNDVIFKPVDPPALLGKVQELTAGGESRCQA
jgi:DNA-binding response OmpR family regulator